MEGFSRATKWNSPEGFFWGFFWSEQERRLCLSGMGLQSRGVQQVILPCSVPFILTDSKFLGHWSSRQVIRKGKGGKFAGFMLNEKTLSCKYTMTGFSNCVALIILPCTAGLVWKWFIPLRARLHHDPFQLQHFCWELHYPYWLWEKLFFPLLFDFHGKEEQYDLYKLYVWLLSKLF